MQAKTSMGRIRSRSLALIAAITVSLSVPSVVLSNAGEESQGSKGNSAKYRPRGQRRVITVYDPWGFGGAAMPYRNPVIEDLAKNNPQGWKKAVEAIVDVHAEAGVDTIVHCVFSGFTHLFPASVSKVAYHVEHSSCWGNIWGKPWKRLTEAGYDFIEIALNQAHRRGLTFLAGLRMNDRHSCRQKEKLYLEHPEWHLEGFPGGFDYSKQVVRDRMLAFVKEVLDQYEVDGIEYDWMRWVHVFPRGTEKKNGALLTDFHRRTRELVNQAARKRGRKLLFGVRVPHVLKQCQEVGFDVPTWIEEGLVDYIAPSHFGHMDYNARIEDFRKLTEGTHCRVYPSTQGHGWTGPSRLQEYGPEHYYAVAHNWYAFGADGIQTYNYQFRWMKAMLPRLLALKPLRDLRVLGEYDRDYLFWRHHGPPQAANAAAMQYDVINLNRAATNPRGTFQFRLAEDLTDPKLSAVMEFKAVGMAEEDALEVELNRQKVAADRIKCFQVWDGTGELKSYQVKDRYGKDKWIREGDHEAYYLCRLPLGSPPMLYGDNQLAVRLAKSAGSEGVIRVEEVDIKVHVK